MKITIIYGVEFDKNQNPVGYCRQLENEILQRVTNVFGGCTILECRGAWISVAGHLVVEHGRLLQIDRVAYMDLPKARDLAAGIRDLLNQESVVYSESSVEAQFI